MINDVQIAVAAKSVILQNKIFVLVIVVGNERVICLFVINSCVYFCYLISQECVNEAKAPSTLLIMVTRSFLFFDYDLIKLLAFELSQGHGKRWIHISSIAQVHLGLTHFITLTPQLLLSECKVLKVTHFLHINLHLTIA